MKKTTLLLMIALFSLSLFGQEEPFVKDVDDLLWQSNRSTALLLMGEKHKDFKLVGGTFEILDSAYFVVDGDKKQVAYERMQYVNAEKRVLIQFIYVDDKLYGKNISYYFTSDEMPKAEKLYNKYNHAFETSNELAFLMGMGHDEIYFKDETVAAGKMRLYPAKRVHYDVWEGHVGLVLNIPDIYKLKDIHQNKGVWMFVTAYNTFDSPVSTKYNFPKLNPPYATFEELVAKANE
jgi:hypothetical protein